MTESFSIESRDGKSGARAGCLRTNHGAVDTPIFMPVGTQATVKGVTPAQLAELRAPIILGNTYHLNLRPGSELIAEMGGLHAFMNWPGAILTDSGGFQVFSLSSLREITEAGVRFRSHLDGSPHFLGPDEVVGIQDNLGSDIAMVLDECPPWPCERDACAAAVGRTIRWARRCRDAAIERGMFERGHHLFGIVQGSTYADLRRSCAEALVELDLPGYAIGGVSVGEPEEEMIHQVEATVPSLPGDKPRYVMGVGTPPQILRMIGLGVDMFDCVMPTRAARHGQAFTFEGTINLRNRRFRDDSGPLVEGLDNYTCRNFSRAYLRHLITSRESLGGTLLTIHNIHFYLNLVGEARKQIAEGTFAEWSRRWIQRYRNEES